MERDFFTIRCCLRQLRLHWSIRHPRTALFDWFPYKLYFCIIMQSTDNSPRCCIEWLRWWFLASRRLTAFSLSSPSLRGQLQGIWLDRHVSYSADWPVTYHSLLFLCSGSSLLFGSQFLASGPGLHICSRARIILPTHGLGFSGCREQPDAISISLRWWLHW